MCVCLGMHTKSSVTNEFFDTLEHVGALINLCTETLLWSRFFFFLHFVAAILLTYLLSCDLLFMPVFVLLG
jgi:hypothetical protein